MLSLIIAVQVKELRNKAVNRKKWETIQEVGKYIFCGGVVTTFIVIVLGGFVELFIFAGKLPGFYGAIGALAS